MSDLIRCTGCKGQKKITGLGLIERNCPDCEGIGHVKKPAEPEQETVTIDDTPADTIPKKSKTKANR